MTRRHATTEDGARAVVKHTHVRYFTEGEMDEALAAFRALMRYSIPFRVEDDRGGSGAWMVLADFTGWRGTLDREWEGV